MTGWTLAVALLLLAGLATSAVAEREHEAEPATGPAGAIAERLAELPTAAARHHFNPISSPQTNQFNADAIVRSFTADVAPCSVGTGLAFDGSDLLLSCWYTNTIEVVSRDDGALLATHQIAGLSGIGALAWDAADGLLWACDASSQAVVTIDLDSNEAQQRFDSQGCLDGLGFDASDNTVWASADAASSVQHYRLDGTLIQSFDLNDTLGGCGNSGIAVGASMLFLANDGCSEIYQVPKDAIGATGVGNQTTLIGGYPARLEDLECDDQTFDGKTVIWSKDAYDATINAFDVGSVDCGVGGYHDADGDGLSDELEQSPELQAMGADPQHKDLFVELDYYAEKPLKIGGLDVGGTSDKPAPDVINKVVTSYDAMGIPNPDGKNGIHLHLDGGPDTTMNPATGEKWGARSRSNAIYGASSPTDWGDADYWSHLDDLRDANVDAERRATFHYAVLVDHLENCVLCIHGRTTGRSRGIPGHDLLVAADDLNAQSEAVTLAHELGHNVGLGHGGAANAQHPYTQGLNNKANYLSIMNYFYSEKGLEIDVAGKKHDGFIAFSPQALGTLDMDNLDEQAGLDPDPFGHMFVEHYCPNGSKAKPGDGWAAIDWDCSDGIGNDSANHRLQQQPSAQALADDPSLDRYVYGSNDYARHALRFWGVGDAWDAANRAMTDIEQPGTDEPTIEELRSDDAFYPDSTLLADPPQDVTVAPDSGTISVPIAVSNPLDTDTTADVALAEGPPGTSLETNGSLAVGARSTATRALLVDTAQLTPGGDASVRVTFSVADVGVVATAQLTVHVLAAGTTITCEQAAAIVADPSATPMQVAAAQATLAGCGRSGGGGAGGSGPSPGGMAGGGTVGGLPAPGIAPAPAFDRNLLLLGLRSLLHSPRHPHRGRLLGAGGFRAAFNAPVAGLLEMRWRATRRTGVASGSGGRLLAFGRVRAVAAGRLMVRVRLTAAGRRALAAPRSTTLRASASFRPSGGSVITVERAFRIAGRR